MRHLLLLSLLLFANVQSSAGQTQDTAPPVRVVSATDLQADGRLARRERRVILLLVSQEGCNYCEQIKREIIKPMIRSGHYDSRLIIRELMIDGGAESTDFNGRLRKNHDLAFSRYQAGLTPTLLFLAPDGEELVPKMIGIQTPEMYYYYVEQSIEQAYAKLQQQTATAEPH